jgi:hypothetical protein
LQANGRGNGAERNFHLVVFGVAEVAERNEAICTKRSEVGNPVLGDAAATGLYLLPGASAHLGALSLILFYILSLTLSKT